MSPSSKPQIDKTDRSAVAIAGIGLGIAAVASSGLLLVAGFIPQPAQAVEEKHDPVPVTAQVAAKAPAALVVPAALLESPGSGIEPDGSIMGSSNTPWPMDCAAEDSPAPLASLSRAMTTDAGRVQVTVQSFAPGAGAVAFEAQSSSAPSCRGGAGFSKVGEAGTEQAIWNGSRSGTRVNGTSFRTGDVIVHVSGQGPQTAAGTLSATLEDLLAEVCVDPSSSTADWVRNPLSPEPGPWMVETIAEIDDPGLPELPEGSDYEPTPIPAEDLPTPEHVKPAQIPDWPVWPLMPEPLTEPQAPDAPADEPVLEAGIEVIREDTEGPGCGWSWTGQAPAVHDSQEAYKTNLFTTLTAMDKLDAEATDWQGEVSNYWKAVAEYKADTQEWEQYAAEVAEVNEAWAVIADRWDRYYEELEIWEANEQDILRVEDAKEDTRDLWQRNLRQCFEDNGQPVPETVEDLTEIANEVANAAPAMILPASPLQPSEEPTPTPSESADPAPAPEPLDCQAVFPRPALLDMDSPDSYDKPTEPADPRPENWEQIVAGQDESEQ